MELSSAVKEQKKQAVCFWFLVVETGQGGRETGAARAKYSYNRVWQSFWPSAIADGTWDGRVRRFDKRRPKGRPVHGRSDNRRDTGDDGIWQASGSARRGAHHGRDCADAVRAHPSPRPAAGRFCLSREACDRIFSVGNVDCAERGAVAGAVCDWAVAALRPGVAPQGLESAHENGCRPFGTQSNFPLYPALTCRAIGRRPIRGCNLAGPIRLFAHNPVLTHSLKPLPTRHAWSQCWTCCAAPKASGTSSPSRSNTSKNSPPGSRPNPAAVHCA